MHQALNQAKYTLSDPLHLVQPQVQEYNDASYSCWLAPQTREKTLKQCNNSKYCFQKNPNKKDPTHECLCWLLQATLLNWYMQLMLSVYFIFHQGLHKANMLWIHMLASVPCQLFRRGSVALNRKDRPQDSLSALLIPWQCLHSPDDKMFHSISHHTNQKWQESAVGLIACKLMISQWSGSQTLSNRVRSYWKRLHDQAKFSFRRVCWISPVKWGDKKMNAAHAVHTLLIHT